MTKPRTTTPETLEMRATLLRRAVEAQRGHDEAKGLAREASDDRRAALHNAYVAGVTIPELAAALGVSVEAISKALGRPRRARGASVTDATPLGG